MENNYKIYYGNLSECIYAGSAGNFFGIPHSKVVKEGVYFVEIEENRFVILEDLVDSLYSKNIIKRKPQVFKYYAMNVGELLVTDLVNINELLEKNIQRVLK